MKNKLTKTSQQTVKFFEEFIRKDEVVHFIKEYRKDLGFPENGFPFTENDAREIEEDKLALILFIPKKILEKIEKGRVMRIINTCGAFVSQFGIKSMYIPVMLRLFLIFNKTIDISHKMLNAEDDLLKIEHIPSELSWYDNEDHFLLKCMYEHFDSISKKYPVALYINPEVSQNQIKDFISKNWVYIKCHQEKGKGISSTTRSKKKQERNDFIYENSNLPIAKIRRKLAEEMSEFLDDGHIGKIIQIEKKRRS